MAFNRININRKLSCVFDRFPAYGSGSSPNDKYYFTVLVKVWIYNLKAYNKSQVINNRSSFLLNLNKKQEAKPVYSANGLLLTAAAPVNPVQVEAGYEVDQIAKYFIFKHITKPCICQK